MSRIVYAVLLVVTLFLLGFRFYPQFRQITRRFFLPYLQKISRIQIGMEAEGTLSELQEKLRKKEQEIQELMYLQRLQQYIARENLSLRQQMGLTPPVGYQFLYANILSRDPAQGGRVLVLDKGKRDGVQEGLAVVIQNKLLGRILEVDQCTSVVVTLPDPRCRVPVRIVGLPAYGLLEGRGEERWKSRSFCLIKYLPPDLSYRSGLQVETSGFSRYMPPGLLVGSIQPRDQNPQSLLINYQGLYFNVWMVPSADLGDLRWVSILIPQILDSGLNEE